MITKSSEVSTEMVEEKYDIKINTVYILIIKYCPKSFE